MKRILSTLSLIVIALFTFNTANATGKQTSWSDGTDFHHSNKPTYKNSKGEDCDEYGNPVRHPSKPSDPSSSNSNSNNNGNWNSNSNSNRNSNRNSNSNTNKNTNTSSSTSAAAGVGLGVGVGVGGAGGAGGSVGNISATGGAGGSVGTVTSTSKGGNATGGSVGNVSGGTSSANGTNKSTNTLGQGQSQGQSSSLTGGNQSLSGSGNSNLNVSTGDSGSYSSNYDYRVNIPPAIIPPTPTSTLATPTMLQTTSACGPLQRVVHTRIDGHELGMIWNSSFDNGYTDELVDFTDNQGNIVIYKEMQVGGVTKYFGHQVFALSAVIGVAAAKNLALGGGGTNGNWGQGGGGTSSSVQQMITHYTLRLCEVAPAEPVYVPQPQVFYPKEVKDLPDVTGGKE